MLSVPAAEVKTVVVGYHPASGLMHGSKDGAMKSGYAYDYIQEMAVHTGWRYRYVYGGFNELYEKLKTGEIDVLPYVTRTERRERDVAFPSRPMGENRLYLVALKPERIGEDLAELRGRRIGLLRGSYSSDVFRKRLAEKGVECGFVEYGLSEDRIAALRKGEVDLIVETSTSSYHDDVSIVLELDVPHLIYMAVSKKRPDLLAELNAAQKECDELSPGLLGTLRWKHFRGMTVHREIGEEARKWFSEHPTLRIGTYRGDSFWIRQNPDGSHCGVLADYIEALMKSLGLTIAVEWKFYDGREMALKALRDNQIDLLNPYYCSYYDAEQDGVMISDRALKCSFSVLYLGRYTHDTMSVIATPSSRLGARYVRDNYPNARIVPCRNGAECVEKLLAGEANSVVMNSEGLRRIFGTYNRDFNFRPLNADCPIAFAAMPHNTVLMSVINRAIPLISMTELNAMFDKYGADGATRITIRQFLAAHPEYVCLAIAVLLIVLLVFHVLKIRSGRNRMAAEMANRTLTFVNYFMDSFVSSYSVNLRTHEFKPYSRDPRIERDYPVVPDYLESLREYAEREIFPEERKEFLEFVQPENLKKLLKERSVVSLSFRVREDGVDKVYGLRVVRGGDEDSVAFVFADVTEEAMREQEHQRQAAMAEARTKFFFNVSHDVRTPVHAIKGLIDMCLDDFDDRDRVKDCLGKMKSSCGLLLSIIKSVLDMSRIEAGKVKCEENYGDVMLSFHEIEPAVRELANEKDISLEFEYGEIRDRYIIADYEKCSRVFVNIISNAIKYTPDGGRIRVKCEQVVGDEECRMKNEELRTGNEVAIYRYTFEDNGVGMSEEFQKRLYEKFSRERNTTMSGVSGLGLGMAIVKSFVDILGGRIECRSKRDEGTVFTVTLPFTVQKGRKWIDPLTGSVRDADREKANPGAASGNADGSAQASFAGRHALLVDDTKMSRMVALHYLEKAGLVVDTAVNGREAVEKVTVAPGHAAYDIILMDMQMPVLDGIGAARAIRGWESDQGIANAERIPIIAWTANAYDEDVKSALDAGMNGHIAKGVKSAVLIDTLARFLGSDT